MMMVKAETGLQEMKYHSLLDCQKINHRTWFWKCHFYAKLKVNVIVSNTSKVPNQIHSLKLQYAGRYNSFECNS